MQFVIWGADFDVTCDLLSSTLTLEVKGTLNMWPESTGLCRWFKSWLRVPPSVTSPGKLHQNWGVCSAKLYIGSKP